MHAGSINGHLGHMVSQGNYGLDISYSSIHVGSVGQRCMYTMLPSRIYSGFGSREQG